MRVKDFMSGDTYEVPEGGVLRWFSGSNGTFHLTVGDSDLKVYAPSFEIRDAEFGAHKICPTCGK